MGKVYHSSDKMDWATPDSVFDPLNEEFGFTLDVAASAENHKCEEYFTKEVDALTRYWEGVCWMNPPYGREIGKWVQKAYKEKDYGVTTVCLVPARTDTQWWSIFWDHENHCTRDPEDEVRFVKGRVKFKGAPASAPFPSAVIVLRGAVETRWCPQCQNSVRMDDPCTKNRTCGLRAENRVETANVQR